MGVEVKGERNQWSLKSSLEELALLADTAGAQVVGTMAQHLQRASPRYYLGSGKLEELTALKKECSYNVVVFNDELSPIQQRNLEEVLETKVIDRTALILDIFARRARTREGQLQVELAQYKYLLPRLMGQWSHLERLGAGIGTRGPGESQIETDRRLIEKRIRRLQKEIEEVRQHRRLYRYWRKKQGITIVSLIGYTNAGKSTLMNALTDAGVLVEDKLFSTLDPVARQLTLLNNQKILVTDTVGFIQKLPTTLVAAFKATLEELSEADLLLHIVDITHKDAAVQSETVTKILAELGLESKPCILVLNKIDLLQNTDLQNLEDITNDYLGKFGKVGQGIVPISAERKLNLDRLMNAIATALEQSKPETIADAAD